MLQIALLQRSVWLSTSRSKQSFSRLFNDVYKCIISESVAILHFTSMKQEFLQKLSLTFGSLEPREYPKRHIWPFDLSFVLATVFAKILTLAIRREQRNKYLKMIAGKVCN